jgi:hypothetical protein
MGRRAAYAMHGVGRQAVVPTNHQTPDGCSLVGGVRGVRVGSLSRQNAIRVAKARSTTSREVSKSLNSAN